MDTLKAGFSYFWRPSSQQPTVKREESNSIPVSRKGDYRLWLLENHPDLYKVSLYGDDEMMQSIQTHLPGDSWDNITPNEDQPPFMNFCQFTYFQMLLLKRAPLSLIQKFVEYEAKHGIPASTRCVNGQMNATMMAAMMVWPEAFQYFIEKSADPYWPTCTDAAGRNVAHLLFLPSFQKMGGQLTSEDFKKMILLMLDAGVNFLKKDNFQRSALYYLRVYYPEVLDDLELSALNALIDPLEVIDIDAKLIIQDVWGNTPAQTLALKKDNCEDLARLYAKGGSFTPNFTSQTTLATLIVAGGEQDAAEFLIDTVQAKGGYPMVQNEIGSISMLSYACNFANEAIFDLLLERNPESVHSTDKRGRTIVHALCMSSSGNTNALISMLTKLQAIPGFDMNKPDVYGIPPAFYGYAKNPGLMPYLLPNMPDNIKEALPQLADLLQPDVALVNPFFDIYNKLSANFEEKVEVDKPLVAPVEAPEEQRAEVCGM